MIKVSGNRISPTEIEEAALASGAVRDAAALGVPDERLGQAIVLVAVAKGEDAEERLRAYLRRELPAAHAAAADRLARRAAGRPQRQARSDRAVKGVGMKAMGPIPPGFAADAQRPAADRRCDRRELVAEAGGTPCSSTTAGRIGRQIARFRAPCPTKSRCIMPSKQILTRHCCHGLRDICRRLRRRLGRRAWAGSPTSACRSASPGPASATELETAIRAGSHDQPRKRRRGGARAGHRRHGTAARQSSRCGSIRRSRSRARA